MRKFITSIILATFIGSSIQAPVYGSTQLTTGAQMALGNQLPWMPKPGVRLGLSPEFSPAYLKGIVVHPEDPFKFDFIIYKGDKPLSDAQKRQEYTKLTKYFLASLAIPDDDQWVNLSPYEKDRIIKDDFGKTLMGRDLLAQDYILKQITASLIYPEEDLGKNFWNKVYAKAQQQYGTTNIPVNTFNKVWILPDDALIYEKGNTAYVLKNHLKVMLEQDYLALSRHSEGARSATEESKGVLRSFANAQDDKTHALSSQLIRELILPALEKEVNEGKNFALLRQVYSGMLLAAWFKRTLRKSILGQIYADKTKLKGVDQPACRQAGTLCIDNETIYQRYLRAYKKGVFNYIKEDADAYSSQPIPRKYFSGGTFGYGLKGDLAQLGKDPIRIDFALTAQQARDVEIQILNEDSAQVSMDKATAPKDAAMIKKKTTEGEDYQEFLKLWAGGESSIGALINWARARGFEGKKIYGWNIGYVGFGRHKTGYYFSDITNFRGNSHSVNGYSVSLFDPDIIKPDVDPYDPFRSDTTFDDIFNLLAEGVRQHVPGESKGIFLFRHTVYGWEAFMLDHGPGAVAPGTVTKKQFENVFKKEGARYWKIVSSTLRDLRLSYLKSTKDETEWIYPKPSYLKKPKDETEIVLPIEWNDETYKTAIRVIREEVGSENDSEKIFQILQEGARLRPAKIQNIFSNSLRYPGNWDPIQQRERGRGIGKIARDAPLMRVISINDSKIHIAERNNILDDFEHVQRTDISFSSEDAGISGNATGFIIHLFIPYWRTSGYVEGFSAPSPKDIFGNVIVVNKGQEKPYSTIWMQHPADIPRGIKVGDKVRIEYYEHRFRPAKINIVNLEGELLELPSPENEGVFVFNVGNEKREISRARVTKINRINGIENVVDQNPNPAMTAFAVQIDRRVRRIVDEINKSNLNFDINVRDDEETGSVLVTITQQSRDAKSLIYQIRDSFLKLMHGDKFNVFPTEVLPLFQYEFECTVLNTEKKTPEQLKEIIQRELKKLGLNEEAKSFDRLSSFDDIIEEFIFVKQKNEYLDNKRIRDVFRSMDGAIEQIINSHSAADKKNGKFPSPSPSSWGDKAMTKEAEDIQQQKNFVNQKFKRFTRAIFRLQAKLKEQKLDGLPEVKAILNICFKEWEILSGRRSIAKFNSQMEVSSLNNYHKFINAVYGSDKENLLELFRIGLWKDALKKTGRLRILPVLSNMDRIGKLILSLERKNPQAASRLVEILMPLDIDLFLGLDSIKAESVVVEQMLKKQEAKPTRSLIEDARFFEDMYYDPLFQRLPETDRNLIRPVLMALGKAMGPGGINADIQSLDTGLRGSSSLDSFISELTIQNDRELEKILADFHRRDLLLIILEYMRFNPHHINAFYSGMINQRIEELDHAMTNGGIDLNSANLSMIIKRDGKGVVLPLAQQDLAQLSNIEGLDPVILSIKPASQTPLFSQLQTSP